MTACTSISRRALSLDLPYNTQHGRVRSAINMAPQPSFGSIGVEFDRAIERFTGGVAAFQTTKTIFHNIQPSPTLFPKNEVDQGKTHGQVRQLELRIFAREYCPSPEPQRTENSVFRRNQSLSNRPVVALQVIWFRPELTTMLTTDYGRDYLEDFLKFLRQVDTVERA